MAHYIGIIHKEPASDYGVSFPDFPGCVTAGTDLDDARRMSEEALAYHVEGMMEDGEPIPAPSSLEEVMRDPIFSDIDMLPMEIPDVVTSFPGFAEAMLRLHTAWKEEQFAHVTMF